MAEEYSDEDFLEDDYGDLSDSDKTGRTSSAVIRTTSMDPLRTW